MLKQALATAAVWLAFVIAIDLPSVVAASGVVFAFLFAWWDEQKGRPAELDDGVPAYADDDLFEEQVTLLDV